MKIKYIVVIALVVVAGFLFYASAYVVDETEQVVITQFGKVVDEPKTEPGLYFRLPFIQRPNYFLKNIQAWDGEPGQIPTRDKTYLWVDAFARWRIDDPVAFFKTVTDRFSGLKRLDDIINPAVRNAVTSHELIETVRNSNRSMTTLEGKGSSQPDLITTGREKLNDMILKASQPKLNRFGIELIDVKMKRVNYVKQVRDSVYGRMIAERKQMAEKIRSEGQGEAKRIMGQKERDLREIRSEAYEKAEEIKGDADAKATEIYAEAYNADPEYYSFTKSLSVYQESLDKKSNLVLSTDSELLQYL
ncbi:MAG TPA: protease modulator HflC [Desulfosalsimonadaceae bacterium]|nr:protease modulator HflC [Desulfosalsimonadaceae bacterium]